MTVTVPPLGGNEGGKEFRDGNGPGPEGHVLGMLATDPESVGESPLIR